MRPEELQARSVDAISGGIHVASTPAAESTRWPRITLVTPVYNGIRYIEATIRSIIYQGYPNLEYIVVDGGSTDGTIDIIQKYEKHISWRIRRPEYRLLPVHRKCYGLIGGYRFHSDAISSSNMERYKSKMRQNY
jgi:cellulose synthase/poly-beta-1,6-N-acetylglucosamine synthase-like glycosyltransferase